VGLDVNITEYPKPQPPGAKPEAPERPPASITSFSGFVGFFDKFVNRQKALTLEQAVHKTSTQPAIRHKLKGRGIVAEGSYADIVLMDLENLKVTATPLDPAKQPAGIEYVFVNGVAVVRNAKHTGTTSGRVLKRE